MNVLYVTGYQPRELNIYSPNDKKVEIIKYALQKRLLAFIEEGLEWIMISGQLGVEMYAAEIVLELKESYEIKLAVIPPFENHESRWPEGLQEHYYYIAEQADFVETIYQGEYKGPYQFKARDKWILEKSDACLMVVDEDTAGSNRFFLDEAARFIQGNQEYPIYKITPFDLEDAVQELEWQNPDKWEEQ